MSKEITQDETQEGISLEYKEEIRGIRENKKYEEEKPEKEEYVASKDIVKCFLFHELISRPISLRR
ncbi:MAG TPA: hypothetical protein PLH42_02340 [bacterium]|nr:hypothetical protein [bacterium]HOL54587.1 hypothetical protein [bacterium]